MFFFKLDVAILYDSSVHFNKRLYVKFGIDITHIRLSRTLNNIVSQPLIYVRDSLTKETFKALKNLHEVSLQISIHSLPFQWFDSSSCLYAS